MTRSGCDPREGRGLCGVAVFLLLILVLFAAGPVSATGLADIYLLAQKNDPSFQSAYFQKLTVKEGRKQAISQLLPTLAASADYTNTTQDIKSSDNDVIGAGRTDFDSTSYGLTITQPVFHWDSIVGLSQSNAANMRAEAEYALAQQELIIRVTDLYLQSLAARDQLTYANAEQVAVEKHFELASGRFEMGLIPITDLHDAKARMAAVQALTIEAQNIYADTLQALQEVTGDPVTELNLLQAEVPLLSPDPTDLDSWVTGSLKQNPAIEVQRYAVEVASQEVERQQAGHYPTVDLVGRYYNKDTDGTLFGGGSDVDTTDLMIQLNVPLYQGGYVSSRVRESKHQLSSARQNLTRQMRAVERQTRSSFLGVKSSLRRVEALQQSLEANQLALDAKQEGFLSGLYTSLNVLDAERDLSLVSIDYAQARYSYILNSLKLKQSVGSLNSQDLLAIDRWFR